MTTQSLIQTNSFLKEYIQVFGENEQQKNAFIEVFEFLYRFYLGDESKKYFLLTGYAGTGKSFLISKIIDFFKLNREFNINIAVCALTWQAAKVLKQKKIENAQSIHSLIYTAYRDKNGEWHFRKKLKEELEHISFIIVDEASMVGYSMRQELESFNIPIIYVGDGFQLPPIEQDQILNERNIKFFANPDINLEKIVRQSEGNPIIKISMDLRNGINFKLGSYDNKVFIVPQTKITDKFLLKADKVIVGTNKTRKNINDRIRNLKGYNSNNFPEAGEPLILFSSNKERGLYNSDILYCKISENHNPLDDQLRYISCERDDKAEYSIEQELVSLIYHDLPKNKYYNRLKDFCYWSFGYAVTCHKAQGSQYDRVIVFDESYCWTGEEAYRWKYTAITRAIEKLIVGI